MPNGVKPRWRTQFMNHATAQSHNEGNHEANDEYGPLMGVGGHAARDHARRPD